MNLMKYAGANEWAMEKAKPLTPKSDRRWEGRIAPITVPGGGCPEPKCVKRQAHEGECWPR